MNTLLPSSGRTARLSNASSERILELGRSNLQALHEILLWNAQHNIRLFRICSGIIPFGSHPVNQLSWWELLAPELERVGQVIKQESMRVSMHPGQYTVLNSPREAVVANSAAELVYHARLLEAIGTDSSHKIILHAGGVYGDKPSSMLRFIDNIGLLPANVRQRLVLENDETNYSLADVLSIAAPAKIPVVFDVFHHIWNPSFEEESLVKQVERAGDTWKTADGRQKLHYSDQWPGKPAGSHAVSIDVAAFSQFYHQIRALDLDIMLEVKDKEQSVLNLYRNFPELNASQSSGRF